MDTCTANRGTLIGRWAHHDTGGRCVAIREGWYKVIEPGGMFGPAHRFVENRADCGLLLVPDGGLGVGSDGEIHNIGNRPKRHPVLDSHRLCSVCKRIGDLEEELRSVTASAEHLKDLREAVHESGHSFTIEWNDDSGINNRGTDGFGIIASCVVHGAKEKIVQLNFTYYAQDTDDEPIMDLTALCQDIGDMIHERLDA